MINVILLNADPQYEDVNRKYLDKSEKLHLSAVFDSPDEAISYLEENAVDAVFVDCNLMSFDLEDFIRKTRECGIGSEFIITTATNDAAEISKIEYIGVFEIIIKPFGYELFSKIVDALERYIVSGCGVREAAHIERCSFSEDNMNELEQTVIELMSEKEMSVSELSVKLGLSRISVRQCINSLMTKGAVEFVIDDNPNAVMRYRKSRLF